MRRKLESNRAARFAAGPGGREVPAMAPKTGARRLAVALALLLSGAAAGDPGPSRYHPTQWAPWSNPAAPAPAPRLIPVPPDEEPPPIVRIRAVTAEEIDRARAIGLTQVPGPERVFRLESE